MLHKRLRGHLDRPPSPPGTYIAPPYDNSSSGSSTKSEHVSRQKCKVLCVSAIHDRASDKFIKETLYREYKRFGDCRIRVTHDDLKERVAYVCFRTAEDARVAKRAKCHVAFYEKVTLIEPVYESVEPKHKYRPRFPTPEQMYDPPPPHRPNLPFVPFYGPPMAMRPYYPPIMHQGPPPYPMPHHDYSPRYMIPRTPHEKRKDTFPNYLHHVAPEDDPMATRTLYVGNLEIDVTENKLHRLFSKYGICEDIDIKCPVSGSGSTFAFIRFQNLDMAYRAKVELSGQQIGKFQCKIGYGKSIPTKRVWVGGLGWWTSLNQLEREFDRFGAIKNIEYNEGDTCTYITYETIDAAKEAVKEMRGFALGGPERRLRIDFADSSNGKASNSNVVGPSRCADVPEEEHDEPREEYRGRGAHSKPHRATGGEECQPSAPILEDKPHTARRSADRGPDVDRSRSPSLRRRPSPDFNSSFKGTGKLEKCRTFKEIVRKCLFQWSGALILKNLLFPVQFYCTDGDSGIIDGLIKNKDIHITQRIRLEQSKLSGVRNRISASTSHAIFLGLARSGSSIAIDNNRVQIRSLRNLVLYLKKKEAAAVISLFNEETAAIGALYAFPPCEFSTELLKKTCNSLSENGLKEDHLVIVVIRG